MRLRFKSRKVLNKSEHLKRRTKTLMIMTMIWNGHSMSILCRSNEDACLLISWKSSWAHGKCWRLTLQTACLGREGGSRRESSQCRGRGPGWGPRLVSSSCLVRREGGSRWCWGCTCHCGPCSRPPRQQSPATSGKSSVPACQAIWNTERLSQSDCWLRHNYKPVLQLVQEHGGHVGGRLEVVNDHLQDKSLPTGQLHVVQLVSVNFPAIKKVSVSVW